MELTVDQAREFLASLGIVLPEFLLEALVDQVNSVYQCLVDAGYPASTITLILTYLLALLGVVQTYKYVTSERAPSGASRSYKFGTLADGYKMYLSLLRTWDKTGCTDGLIPDDPSDDSSGGIWVAGGGCCR